MRSILGFPNPVNELAAMKNVMINAPQSGQYA
jgi:hypothetical protein